MSEVLKTYDQLTSSNIESVTSSLVLADGRLLYGPQVGQRIAKYGLDHALASLSARQARAAGLLTSGTYGRPGYIWSGPVNLQFSLESKLRMRCRGGIWFRQTWKEKTTPAGRPLLAHTASAHRTSGNGSTGWPSPKANNHTGAGTRGEGGENLQTIASWATPTKNDSSSTRNSTAKRSPGQTHHHSGQTLVDQVTLTVETGSAGQLNPEHSRWLMGYPAVWGSCGATAMRSFPRTARRSSERT
jgi:hypothetical protein